MRHSEKYTRWAFIVALFTPLALIVPNVILDFTESEPNLVAKILNVILPLSVYFFIVGIFRVTGKGVMLTFPFMLFSAFQIVLIYLYGESIIAVDMFLNVATTDFDEASTLLNNLTPAIILCVILYLPPLIFAVWDLIVKKQIDKYKRLLILGWSIPIMLLSGILLLVLSLTGSVKPGDDIFPINVISNVCTAVKRDRLSKEYPRSASGFTYNASKTDSGRRVIALVVGETARPDRWQLFGGERPTNPRLSQRDNLFLFPKSLTQSNTTHKSVPMLITPLTSENFDSLNNYKSIITAFREARYKKAWISNQPPNGSYNEKMGTEADTVVIRKYARDVELAKIAEELLEETDSTRDVLLVFHTYGNHFPYNQRYNPEERVFEPDAPIEARRENRERVLNAYDNATIAVDLALDSLISVIERQSGLGAVLYTADHGEDIFDDSRNKFLHASPAPTVYQLRVPMLVWLSDSLVIHDDKGEKLRNNSAHKLSPSVVLFHTAMDLGGVGSPYYNRDLSVASSSFTEEPFMYLTDRNENVPLEQSGIKDIDLEILKEEGIY